MFNLKEIRLHKMMEMMDVLPQIQTQELLARAVRITIRDTN